MKMKLALLLTLTGMALAGDSDTMKEPPAPVVDLAKENAALKKQLADMQRIAQAFQQRYAACETQAIVVEATKAAEAPAK